MKKELLEAIREEQAKALELSIMFDGNGDLVAETAATADFHKLVCVELILESLNGE